MDLTGTYTDYFMMFSQLAETIDNVVPLKPEYLSRHFCVPMKLWCTRPSMGVARLFQGDPISGFTMRTNISSDNVMSDRTFYFAASLKSISFKKIFTVVLIVCACVCMPVSLCVGDCMCPWSSEKGVRPPGAGVTGSGILPIVLWVLGSKLGSSARAVRTCS